MQIAHVTKILDSENHCSIKSFDNASHNSPEVIKHYLIDENGSFNHTIVLEDTISGEYSEAIYLDNQGNVRE